MDELLLAPLPPPLVEVDPPVQDQVDEIRVLPAGAAVDRLEDVEVLLVAALPRLEQRQRLVARQGVGEEETEQRFVAVLDRGRRAEQPLLECLPPGVRELVDAPAAGAIRVLLAADEPFGLEPPQLGIDLPVARCPEEPRRAVDDGLDVVAGAGAEREKTEDDRGDGCLLHLSRRYIAPIYLSSARKRPRLRPPQGGMRWRGLEPPRPMRPLGPQPSASTNSATSARAGHCSATSNSGRARRCSRRRERRRPACSG